MVPYSEGAIQARPFPKVAHDKRIDAVSDEVVKLTRLDAAKIGINA
jgi:phage terminase large subunit-like protein